jgi:phosphosulfolactate phosphohydrolase-like enzyme
MLLKNDTDSFDGFSVTNGDAMSVDGNAKLMGDSLNTVARIEMKFKFATNDFLNSEEIFLRLHDKNDVLFNNDEINEIKLKLERSRSLSRSGFDYSKVVFIE